MYWLVFGKEDGEEMSTPIDYDAIIKANSQGVRRFMARQKWRIRELRRINKRGATEEERAEIIDKLQSAGILDKDTPNDL